MRFKNTIITVGIAILIPVVYGMLATWLANVAAKRFYDRITVGEPVHAVIARAEADHVPNALTTRGERCIFVFRVLPFATATCSVRIENGIIVERTRTRATD